LVARQISLALTEEDAGKAGSAVKDLLDRGIGKPTEKKELKHKLEGLPEEQVDAALATKLAALGLKNSEE
jgi:hypothetical protein